MSDIKYYNASLEIIHQYDITVALVHLRVEYPSAIGRNRKTRVPLRRLFLHHGNLPYPPRGKAEEFDDRMLLRLRVDEVNALVHHGPIAPISCSGLIEHQCLLSALHCNFPNPWSTLAFSIVDELAVGRLEGGEPSFLRHLHGVASFGWRFPHLIISGSIGSEIDPLSISRPARYHIVGSSRSDAAGATSFGVD